jgi:hypothetical protein
MGLLTASDRATRRKPSVGGTRALVLALLFVGWIVPAAIATFQPAGPFVTAVRRAGALARSQPVADGQADFLDVLSEMKTRLPPRREVAIWVDRVPPDLEEIGHVGAFWFMASYLLYPSRVLPLAAPDVIGQLEARQLVAPPLAAVMQERVAMLARRMSPALSIVVWNPRMPCSPTGLGMLPDTRFESILPRGACLFAAGGDHG